MTTEEPTPKLWDVRRHYGWGGSMSPLPTTVLRRLSREEAVRAATELARTAPVGMSFEIAEAAS